MNVIAWWSEEGQMDVSTLQSLILWAILSDAIDRSTIEPRTRPLAMVS